MAATNGGATNGITNGNAAVFPKYTELNRRLAAAATSSHISATYHGDTLLRETHSSPLPAPTLRNQAPEAWAIAKANPMAVLKLLWGALRGQTPDLKSAAALVAQLRDDSIIRDKMLRQRVAGYWDRMLHPPPSFLGDAFQYRTPDGRFNNVQFPHLGQGGAPYARTVPAKSRLLGAQPDPGVIFDRLLARDGAARESQSGLSSLLLYHATIIIHDIFRTNDHDRNISDTSSYLDLSPLYGYNQSTCDAVRDRSQRRGLLKPDTFSEERLLRQPPGVCILLVMYNRYHNYVARQLYRINENGRFQVPERFRDPDVNRAAEAWAYKCAGRGEPFDDAAFRREYDVAWTKLDDDLYNTARLITCGMYINISIHDYLRALMGFHSWDTTFTLDPRVASNVDGIKKDGPPRGGGNQVSVEFNVLYRFHSAMSSDDEAWAVAAMQNVHGVRDTNNMQPEELRKVSDDAKEMRLREPERREFGLARDPDTGLFDDSQMLAVLTKAMRAPLGEFGPQNIPKFMRHFEVRGILQARKWEVGTLNDFREFFGMPRHKTFAEVSANPEIQDALRDLYEHPDKIELYPGVFCECDADKRMGPGPANMKSTLWAAIFSDAITLVRSDRFYTTDWNTNTLTAWGMKEVTPDNDVLKSSVFHRLLQRAFPGRLPYNSLYFFHPFFTPAANEKLAAEQNYLPGLDAKNLKVEQPRPKPKVVKTFALAKELLTEHPHVLVEPASADTTALDPSDRRFKALADILNRRKDPKEMRAADDAAAAAGAAPDKQLLDEARLEKLVCDYTDTLTRDILEREVIRVKRYPPPSPADIKAGKDVHEYHVDIVRDVAIPVVVHLVGNLLSIDSLIRTTQNPGGALSENEIYRHITNCQLFFAYNTDETKQLARRAAFKKSMAFMLDLARSAVERERPGVASRLRALVFGPDEYTLDASRPPAENLARYARAMMRAVLAQEDGDADRAAAAMVLLALDAAFNSVLTLTTILEYFLDGSTPDKSREACPWKKPRQGGLEHWAAIRLLATSSATAAAADEATAYRQLKGYVLEAQRLKLKLPLVRKAVAGIVIGSFELRAHDTVIIDINSALRDPSATDPANNNAPIWGDDPTKFDAARYNYGADSPYMPYGHGLSEGVFLAPRAASRQRAVRMRRASLWAVTSMLRVLAQLEHLAPAPGTQGVVKRINIVQSDSIANWMSPALAATVKKRLRLAQRLADDNDSGCVKVRTYLTPEWDELVPFPCTWKVRFAGYGAGVDRFEAKRRAVRTDDEFDLWQAPGPSTWGGIFTRPAVDEEEEEKKAKEEERRRLEELAKKKFVATPGCGV